MQRDCISTQKILTPFTPRRTINTLIPPYQWKIGMVSCWIDIEAISIHLTCSASKTPCIQHRQVALMAVDDRETRIQNLKRHINVEFSKGWKDCSNEHLEYKLHPWLIWSKTKRVLFCFSNHTLSTRSSRPRNRQRRLEGCLTFPRKANYYIFRQQK